MPNLKLLYFECYLILENSESTVSASSMSNFMNSTIVRSTSLQKTAELYHITGQARLMSYKATVCACFGCMICIVCSCKSMRDDQNASKMFCFKEIKRRVILVREKIMDKVLALLLID